MWGLGEVRARAFEQKYIANHINVSLKRLKERGQTYAEVPAPVAVAEAAAEASAVAEAATAPVGAGLAGASAGAGGAAAGSADNNGAERLSGPLPVNWLGGKGPS